MEDYDGDDETKLLTDGGERSDANELLSPRAEIFRSKLISEFHLLESLGAGGLDVADEPHLHTRDALDDGQCRAMMMKEPNSLIQFQIYSDKVSAWPPWRRRTLRHFLSHCKVLPVPRAA